MTQKYTPRSLTMRVADYAARTPGLAALVFKLSAHGMVMKDIAPHLRKKYQDSEVVPPITDEHVRKILHRRKPFDDPRMFSEVDSNHVRIVESKFRPGYKRRSCQTKKAAPELADQRMEAIKKVYHLRRGYHAALEDAYDLGLSKEAVRSLCALIDDGCLTAEAVK